MANPATIKVRLLHDTIVRGADEPRGEALYGKKGEVHEFDRWVGLHLCQCHPEFPHAELVKPKGN